MIKFANFEFIFAIRGSKINLLGEVYEVNQSSTKYGGFFLLAPK